MSSAGERKGFTIIELLVVVVLGTILVLGTLQVLVTNRRTFTVQNAALQNQQQLRASLEVLLADLRQVSSRGGDILEATTNSVTFRSMRDFGVVCDLDYEASNPPLLRVSMRTSGVFTTGDSLLVFADNNPRRSDDDEWVPVQASGAVNPSASACPSVQLDGAPVVPPTAATVDLNFQGDAATSLADDSVRLGGMVRNFVTHRWTTLSRAEGVFLARASNEDGDDVSSATNLVEVVGPLMPASAADDGIVPLGFRYLDAFGAETTDLTNIRQIEVTVRTWSPVVSAGGDNVQESLTLLVNTRN